jgi:hypothetical protein
MCTTTKNRTIPTMIMDRGLADFALQPCSGVLLLGADLLNSIILVVVLGVCILHRLCSFLLECVLQQELVGRPGRSSRRDETLFRLHARCRTEHKYTDTH